MKLAPKLRGSPPQRPDFLCPIFDQGFKFSAVDKFSAIDKIIIEVVNPFCDGLPRRTLNLTIETSLRR